MDSHAPRVHRQQALAAYVEPLAAGRRVAVLGDASLGLGSRIAELGARSVHLLDPDAERARREAERSPRGVVVAPFPSASSDRELRAAAYDLVVVPNLELFGDAEGLLARIRLWVGEEGSVLVAAPNRDGGDDAAAFDYYELFDLVASQFDDVAMIAQLPFYGVALAELRQEEDDDESPTVTVDMQLAEPNRKPEAYVALASQGGVRLDPYAIVELPPPPPRSVAVEDLAAVRAARSRVSALEEQLAGLRGQVAEVASLRAQAAEVASLRAQVAEVASLRSQVAEVASLRSQAAEVASLRSQVAEVASLRSQAAEVASLRSQVADMAIQLQEARAVADALRDEVARIVELETAVEERSRQLRHVSGEAERLRAAVEAQLRVSAQLEELSDRAERAEAALAAAEPEVDRAAEFHAAELARYEQALGDRAQAMRSLEAELVRRERMVRELVEALAEAAPSAAATHPPAPVPPAPAPPEVDALIATNLNLRQQLDALALELARREGEAQASGWTIAELERRLVQEASRVASNAKPDGVSIANEAHPGGEAERQLAAALDELDVLRRALAQEHEARMQAESSRPGPAENASQASPD